MYGQGLLKGLATTLKEYFGGYTTQEYPDEYPDLPDTFHGSFELDVNKCVGCTACDRNCPNSVIDLKVNRGEDKKKEIARFKVDLTRCQFCGLCTEGCPTNALKFNQEFELATYNKEDLILNLLAEKPTQTKPKKTKEVS